MAPPAGLKRAARLTDIDAPQARALCLMARAHALRTRRLTWN
jgi:hypothetical protein